MSPSRSRRRDPDLEILDQSFEDWLEINSGYRNLAGPRRHLNDRFGKGNWGDDEFVQYMRELYETDRLKAEAIQRREGKERAELPVLPPEATEEERIQAYLDYYEDPAPNDLVMIQAMATLEAAIISARQQWRTILEGEDPSRTAAKTWADIIRGLTREHRLIQDTLGIKRADRDKEDKDADQREYVTSTIQKAAAFVKEHAIPIRCSHCADEDAQVEINMGMILFHFRQDVPWRFECQCPRCEKPVQVPLE
jgi:hypothetical protein